MHPASRGRLCAKGPATINQIHDPDRILYPMKRSGAARRREVGAHFMGRGAGNFRHAHSQSDSGKSRRRSDVSRRPSGPRLHHGAHAAGVGHRRPQLAHQCLLVVGAPGLFALALRRPAIARSRQCALHSSCSRRISSRDIISIRTRSASSTEKWRARNSP